MHNMLERIELASVLNAERTAPTGPRSAAPERAPTLRTRLGQRVIALGERITYGTGVTATR